MTEFRGAVVPRAIEGLRRWRRQDKAVADRRKAIAELDALDNRTLQDIGVDRRSIPELVDAQLQAEAKAAIPHSAAARPGIGARPGTQPC